MDASSQYNAEQIRELKARLDSELAARDARIDELERQLNCVIDERDWLARRPPLPKIRFPKALSLAGFKRPEALAKRELSRN